MAEGDIIQHSSLIEDDAIPFVQAQIEELIAVIEGNLNPAIIESAKNLNLFARGFSIDKASISDIETLNTKFAESTQLSKSNAEATKLLALAKLREAEARKTNAEAAKAELQVTKLSEQAKTKEEAATRKAASAYSQLTAELNKNRQTAKDLQAQVALGNKLTDEQAATLAKATAETQRLDAQVKQIDYSVGQAQRNVGNYNDQLGTLAKSVKGFGALGRIISRAVGIDPEVFNGIREAGIALKDIKHISEGAKLAKEGEAAANVLNTGALQAETVAQEEEAAASALSTGGITLLITALVAGGYAIYEYVSAIHKQREAEIAILEIETERTKRLIESRKLLSKDEDEKFELAQEELVIIGKISEAQKNKNIAERKYNDENAAQAITEGEYLKRIIKATDVQLDANGKLIRSKKEVVAVYEGFGKERVQTGTKEQEDSVYADKVKKFDALMLKQQEENDAARLHIKNDYDDAVTKANQSAEKKTEKKDEEALKRLAEIVKKANEEGAKARATNNEEKVQAEYDAAVKEIDAIKATEKQKRAARAAVDREYRGKFIEAQDKDDEVDFKKRQDEAKKINEENSKQTEKDAKLWDANAQLQETKEIAAVESSTDTEENKQKRILAIKLYYLDIDEKQHSDDLLRIAEDEKKKVELTANGTKEQLAWAKKAVEERIKFENEVFAGVQDGLKKKEELIQQSDQRVIDFHKRTADIETKLAVSGKANSLATEEAAIARAEEKKISDAKKAAKIQEDITLFQVLASSIQESIANKENIFKAIGKAAGAEGAVKALFSRLISGSAYEGTEDTGSGGDLDNKGGMAWILHPNERVMTAEQNKKLNGMSNEELIHNAVMFEQIYKPQFNSSNTAKESTHEVAHDAIMTSTLSKKLDSLQKSIDEKPVASFEIDGLMKIVETVRRGNMTYKTHYIPRRNIR